MDPNSLYRRFFPDHCTLETSRVMLRPMEKNDLSLFRPLCGLADTWKFFSMDLSRPGELDRWVDQALAEKEQQTRMPFTIIDKDTGLVCGSTSFGNISFYDSRIEIGWSWLGTSYMGTGVNKHAKFVLLSYAFEVMRLERVEVKTDVLNERARAALLKVGMIPEGVLRSHMLMHSHRRRDTLYFSILKSEWPSRKASFFPELV